MVVVPNLPDSAIGDLITQRPFTQIGTVPSGCGYNCSCNLHWVICRPRLKSITCPYVPYPWLWKALAYQHLPKVSTPASGGKDIMGKYKKYEKLKIYHNLYIIFEIVFPVFPYFLYFPAVAVKELRGFVTPPPPA